MAVTQGNAAPPRLRARKPGSRTDVDHAAQHDRRAWIAQQRKNRRLLAWGAALFPTDRSEALATRVTAGPTKESDIERVMLQSVSDAQAPHVAAERDLSRTSPGVRRLLSQRRGANALLDEAASLGQLATMPSFALGPSRYPCRPLCDVCGYWGQVTCMVCGEALCSRSCRQTHLETRCEKHA